MKNQARLYGEEDLMLKDIIISILAAVLIVDKLSGMTALSAQYQVGLWIAFTCILIIFCIFLENVADEWRQRRKRLRRIQEQLEKLRGKGEMHHG